MARWEGDELRIELSRVAEVHVRTVGGEVAVTGAHGPPRVEADAIVGDPVRVTLEDGVLTVVHEPEGWLRTMGAGTRTQAAVMLVVPPDTPVTVRTVSADVVAAGLQAGAGITTVSGAITITDLAGDLSVRSVSGDVEAQPVDGEFHVNVVSGSVTAAGRVPVLSGRSVSGDLTFDLGLAPEASLSTVSGEVVLRLPAGSSADLDVTTMSGTLDSAFDIAGTTSRRRLAGRIGDGSGPRLDIRTMSGDVALLSKLPSAVAPAGGDR